MKSELQPSLTIEDVARYPLPGMAFPGSLSFSPDDSLIAGLFSLEGSLARQLYAFDPASGARRLLVRPPGIGLTEQNVSLEDALRRERARQREVGVTEYQWARSRSRLLVPIGGGLYVADSPNSPLRALLEPGEKPALAAQISPNGNWVAFVQDAELHVAPFAGGQPRRLTFTARGSGKTSGLPEYVAAEEMHRYHGYWWSPDSRMLLFVEVDETHIPVYRIVHQGKEFAGEPVQEDHRYPFAGQANARVRLGVVAVDGGEPVWMDLGAQPDIYLARLGWLPDCRPYAQLQNRLQDRLDLLAFDPYTGMPERLLTETSETWINLHNMFYPLSGGLDGRLGGFIWASERTGYNHLYLYSASGDLLRTLTSGEWLVMSIAGVDEDARTVYFTATRADPRQEHLYAVSLDGGEPRRITAEPGIHAVILDHACKRFIDTHSAIDTPPSVRLRSLADGRQLAALYAERDPRIDALGLHPPELVELTSRHDDLLYGAIFRPPASFGPGPYPTVVYVYGGPHPFKSLVMNQWDLTVSMRPQLLARQGFLVFVLDNRGTPRRGLRFESAIRNDMGHAEVEDQVDGVRWLAAQGLADPRRVGVYGWSYGGYMALMCLARAADTFQAAVAGAPVTAWDGYDTHYTERYMGLPQENPDGYQVSSVMAHVPNIKGDLLITHGLIDENVHFRHTARLINALNRARKPYELLIFPDERHMPRRLEDRVYMEERIVKFLKERLLARPV